MHDTLAYFSSDPLLRKQHHPKLTFRQIYAYKENYVLPLSHDEVKRGFGSLLAKMPGDDWQKFANLRLLLAYMYAEPGKKLLFMGGEFGQWQEWNPDQSLDWHLLLDGRHRQIRDLTGYLNWIYRREPSLHQLDSEPAGFEWIECCDSERSIISFIRKARDPGDMVLAVFNFTPIPRFNYRVGAPRGGFWRELLNTDATQYGGAGYGNLGGAEASPIPWNNRRQSLNLTLPPLGAIFLKGA
jgi:1,4-alpha-glucan branching enzyme